VKTLLNANRSVVLKMVVKGCGEARPLVSKAIVLQAADVKPRQNGREALTGSGELLHIYIYIYICICDTSGEI